tara:strand:+ start:3387 stop:4628 length:1242 start_codon:yes stop_codon:yes gene_type:complete
MTTSIENADQLVEKVKQTVLDKVTEIHDKYEQEVEASGKSAKESKESLVKLSESVKGLSEHNEGLNIQIKELSQKLSSGAGQVSNKAPTMAEELQKNTSELRSLAKGHTSTPISIKADTVRASVTDNESAFQLNGLGQLAHAKLTAYDIFTKIPVSDNNTNGVIRYYDWDAATTVRAAAAIAETGTFPESTAKWVGKTLNIEKIGDSLPVSEEFFEDSEMFAAEMSMFLDTNVKIQRNDDLVNGDGVAPNIKGLVTTVGAYTAAASGITDANIYDLLVKVSEDITATGGSKYAPNFALMNIADINEMKLKKDANNNYIIPPFVSRDGKQVAEMLVLEENSMTANTLVVGDSRYGRIYEKKGIEVSRGVVNAQFAEDMETLKVRTRLAFLIRDADVAGFKKVASISADLATLAT